MSEVREELEGQLSEAASLRSTWKSFLEHPGWAIYEATLREQMNLRQKAVCMTPINSMEQCLAQEFFKGEFNGIGDALNLPQAQIELLDLQLKTVGKQLEAEDELEKQISRSHGSRIGGDPFGGDNSE